MFEDMIKALEKTQTISVPIETDDKGYIDKQCPSEDCEFIFKVNAEDWSNIFKDEAVWCPLCRHEETSNQWFTIEQVEHAKSEAFSVVKGKVHNALISGADKFNRRQVGNSFISMSMKVNGGIKRTQLIPVKAAEAMQLEIQCEECTSRFAVIGSAYFCPACGHNSVTQTFSDSLRKIKAKKDNIDIVRHALNETAGKDEAELTCRSMLETCISDGVVAFQKYCEGVYEPFGKAPFNAFQRLEQASKLWLSAVGNSFDDWLSRDELACLNVLYQKRRILAHNEGIVDAKCIAKSGGNSYKEGQRIVVATKDVDILVYLLEKLKAGIEKEIKPV